MDLQEIDGLLRRRIEYYSRPKPDTVKFSPEKMTIKTEDVGKFTIRMILEELKFLRREIISVTLPSIALTYSMP